MKTESHESTFALVGDSIPHQLDDNGKSNLLSCKYGLIRGVHHRLARDSGAVLTEQELGVALVQRSSSAHDPQR